MRASRWVAGLLGLALVVLGTVDAVAGPTDPAADEAVFTARANRERAALGLAALTVKGDLVEVARRHARRLADEQRLRHNPDLPEEVDGWQVVGENVGRGHDAGAVHEAFMASTTHREQIVRPGYREIGVGVVWTGDTLWVVEVLREPMATAAASAPAPQRSAPRPRARRVVAALRPAAAAPPLPPQPPVSTTTTAPALHPPVDGLPPAPRPDVHGVEHVALRAPVVPARIPPLGLVAAGLLLAVVAAQAGIMRRLGLV